MVAERAKMWDLLQDRLPIHICAELFNEEESVTYSNFFNANLVNRFNYLRNQTDTNFSFILLLLLLLSSQHFCYLLSPGIEHC